MSANEKMVMVRRHVHGCQDCRGSDGKWIKTWRSRSPGQIVTNHTRAHGLWGKVERRTKISGPYQIENPAYVGVSNGFSSFQEFAEWCQGQPGYCERDDKGNIWEIDKDILIKGNKIYSPTACCFVPRRINSLFTSCRATRGGLPIGVTYVPITENYRAYCSSGSEFKHLGMFDSPIKAHRAWQQEKANVIELSAREYRSMAGSRPMVMYAILGRAQMILDDLEANRVTIEV